MSALIVMPNAPRITLDNVSYREWFGYNPRISAYQITGTDNIKKALDSFATYASTTGANRDIAVDIETKGTDTDTWWQITCVTVAFHTLGGMVSVLLNPLREPEHRKLLRRVLDISSRIVLHNASFDTPPLVAHGLFTLNDVNKVWDTLVLARQINTSDRAGRTLEDLAVRYQIVPDDGIKMTQVFSASGYGSAKLGFAKGDIDSGTYRDGAMSDTVVTLRLLPTLEQLVTRVHSREMNSRGANLTTDGATELIAKMQRVNQITLRRAARGFKTDPTFLDRFEEETRGEYVAAENVLKESNLEPGRGDKLIEHLHELGQLPDNWPRTPGGTLSADKKAMAKLVDLNHPLAEAHKVIAETNKVHGYLTKVNDQVRATGRLHPMIGVLGAAASGRMCLPTSHSMLSDRGVLAVDEIRVGDRTIDQNGKWTTVTAIHRYNDAEINVWSNMNTCLEFTPNHRWVIRQPWKTTTKVEPLDHRHRAVVLTPFESIFDPHDRAFTMNTPGERFAALVGLLVSDGRCSENPGGMRAYVYQTEGGFYSEFKRVIPREALMYDRITAETKRGSHHEMRVKTKWLRPLLEKAGLNVESGSTLNKSSSLEAWAVSLTTEESREFLKAIWLADGCTAVDSTVSITMDSPELIKAVRIAAYKVGRRVSIRQIKASEWGTKPRTLVCLIKHPHPRTNKMTKTTSRSDVWCVTTEDGTFTAWSDLMGPYLTGNSLSGIELQQFPGNARGILISDDPAGWSSVDWSSIEPVTMGICAGDNQFLDPFFQGQDLYLPVARAAGLIPASMSDEDAMHDKGRKVSKVILLAAMYGMGKASLMTSLSASLKRKVDEEEALSLKKSMQDAMPTTFAFMRDVLRSSEATGKVTTIMGRVLDEDAGYAYRAVNHFCQGSAADILYESTLALDKQGLSDHIHLWMHDELVVDTSVESEVNTVMRTPPQCLLNWQKTNDLVLRTDANPMGMEWKSV